MSTKWTDTNSSNEKVDFSQFFKEEFAVVFLRGKNSFGDHIYSYVKISIPNLTRLQKSLQAKESFIPSDFGEVVAAGKGEPSEALKAEIAQQYPLIDENKPAASASTAPPTEKKAWDEY